jgi:hypothetical protein
LEASWDESGLTTTIAGAGVGISGGFFGWEGFEFDLGKVEDDGEGDRLFRGVRWFEE